MDYLQGRPYRRTPKRIRPIQGGLWFRLGGVCTWCLCYDKWGAPNGEEGNWERKFNRNSPEIANLRKQYPDTLDFYRWLEWIAAEQLSSAQQAAKDAGMHIGIMSDMAVGVHPSGADVWWNPERFAKGATVGAPPDMFNQQGQNWSQPPLSPINLETTGYEAYRNMVHGMFARAGAVRIDTSLACPPVVDSREPFGYGWRLRVLRLRHHAGRSGHRGLSCRRRGRR